MRPVLPKVAVLAAAFAALPAAAQVPAKVHSIGVVLPFERAAIERKAIPVQRPFEEALRELGWVDGRNVKLLWRPKASVEELVRAPVDVIVSFGNPLDEMKATATIPIVAYMGHTAEQVALPPGSRPAPNVTGISVQAHAGLAQKRLELLKEAAGVKRVARVYLAQALHFGDASELLPEYATAARALGLEVFPVTVGGPEDIRAAFAEIARRGNAGVMFGAFRRSLPGMEQRWDAAMEEIARHRLPAIFDVPLAADEGAMMGLGEDVPKRARRLAYFVDRILRGAKPSDLPVEQPVAFELVVNLKAAESIGVKIPPAVLLRADRVIR
jgi:putative ABC transport system substrate-binding protein